MKIVVMDGEEVLLFQLRLFRQWRKLTENESQNLRMDLHTKFPKNLETQEDLLATPGTETPVGMMCAPMTAAVTGIINVRIHLKTQGPRCQDVIQGTLNLAEVSIRDMEDIWKKNFLWLKMIPLGKI